MILEYENMTLKVVVKYTPSALLNFETKLRPFFFLVWSSL